MSRVVALVALVGAAVLLGFVLTRGDGGHEYTLRFQTAGQLVRDDDVQIGGRRIGSIREIELDGDNHALVKVVVEEPYAPLGDGTRAVIRATSLSGVANRYIALVPAPDDAPRLEDGALIQTNDTTTIVDLDQLFNTLDPKARQDLQKVVKGFATQYDGKERETNTALEYLNPFLSTSQRLVGELTEDEATLTDFIVNSSELVTALAERRDDLSGLVANGNATARAIAAESESLNRALQVLPPTLRKANTSFVNLRATLTDLDALVAASKPATRELAPFLRELRPLVADARPTIRDLRRLVTTPGRDNDLIDASNKFPRLARIARPTFRRGIQALEKTQPVVAHYRPYTPELVGWLRDFGQGAANYDANGHYARIQPIFNAYQFGDNPAGGVLTAIPPEDRLDGYETGFITRCPGAASQPPPDRSAPFKDTDGDLDCDPSLVLPGP